MMLGLAEIKLNEHSQALQLATEIAVLISLYAAGIKLRLSLMSNRWRAPVILATLTMVTTIFFCAVVGIFALGLSVPAALLLGSVLSPTDPVLADKVQIESPDDSDKLRQSLTGEAGLNDGTAFPFVLLAIGFCDPQLHPLGAMLWRWIAIDLLWQVAGGLALGILAGTIFGKWSWRRSPHQRHEGVDELLAIGFIAMIYGIALMIHTYGFLAVFAAAVCLRRSETISPELEDPDSKPQVDEHKVTAQNQATLLREQTAVASALERLIQAFLVVVIGIILTSGAFPTWHSWTFAAVLICVLRPMAVLVTLHVKSIDRYQRNLIAWFGIRGIGTLYYLSFAISTGIAEFLGNQLQTEVNTAIAAIVLSLWLHGLSDTPLMRWYSRRSVVSYPDPT